MIEKDEKRNIRLPKGNWLDDLGQKHKSGNTNNFEVPIDRIPAFMLDK